MTEALTMIKPVRLRGRSFLALVLSPELPLKDWLASLDDLAKRSTGFFLGRPIVLDIGGLGIDREALTGLIAALGERNVRIMGIEGAIPSQLSPGMPPEMRGGRAAEDIEAVDDSTVPAATTASPAASAPQVSPILPAQASLLVDVPVRSGQSIIFPEGDVTILGSVASGAEVIAGGSIHVYGALRGRALAGSAGQAGARIFCR
ncbi:MAG: septum formation inhibitor MinC, partial [Hyphomicrobiales bacterium]